MRDADMRDASHASDRPPELLERGVAFDVLCESLESVRRSRKGRVVLVGGEAGVRKTALLRWFCRDEDVHWADEATLDVLKLLARRVAAVPVLVVASFRDDGLDSGHPLRRVLGELATSATVRRLKLDPLSRRRSQSSQNCGPLTRTSSTARPRGTRSSSSRRSLRASTRSPTWSAMPCSHALRA